MPIDPYAVLRALVRAEARRSALPPSESRKTQPQQPAKKDAG
ncbi:hypothetical protein J2Z21_004018 [Streptomyces griseochromogenes]|uniref:Transposase n=1 Tax=Streptomyces griseochromogenes TaxID=68214 RepID=A0ABS4LUH0_9ACTN|nr:hypothetical protein [Streptomyces griseochromogenes]MBP2051068.1 hypothetical protein [Streptomyces griseochromogenes]